MYEAQRVHVEHHTRWARATRLAYNTGILSLLAAITVLLVPPRHTSIVSLWGLAMALAFLGFLAEVIWVAISEALSSEILNRWLSRRAKGRGLPFALQRRTRLGVPRGQVGDHHRLGDAANALAFATLVRCCQRDRSVIVG